MRTDASSGNRKLGLRDTVGMLKLRADCYADRELLKALLDYLHEGGAIQIWKSETVKALKLGSLMRNVKPDFFEAFRTRYPLLERDGKRKVEHLKKIGEVK
jgi:hypothetical protein